MYASVKIIIDNMQVNQDLKAEKDVFFPQSFNKQTNILQQTAWSLHQGYFSTNTTLNVLDTVN